MRKISKGNDMHLKEEMSKMKDTPAEVNAIINDKTGNLIITIDGRDIELSRKECVIVLITLGAILRNDSDR